MQFHLNGFRGSGDPTVLQYQGTEPNFQSSLPDEVDVLIIGAGPAGQLLGAQLAQFPDIVTRIIESKPGRLEQGQADGLQCRTIEIIEAFGFSERVLKEAYWVNETTFWSPSDNGHGLRRSGRVRDTEEGLSEFPHVILNQARLHDFWLDCMKWSPTRLEPSYSRRMLELKIPEEDGPTTVVVERLDEAHKGQHETIRAKYVVGCDGVRSGVRKTLGLEMKGDFMNSTWGVLDALLVTDFPDARLKTVIHSANQGSILIIPREGGYLSRFYIELEKLPNGQRVCRDSITADNLIATAKNIFKPYTFDVRQVAYWSVYEVGQRLTDHFDNIPKLQKGHRDPRVFITGDSCHSHSAKAGQGMNLAFSDSYNLGWKLIHVLRGLSPPSILHTYSSERQAIAQMLIDFDREISRMFAAKPKANASATDEQYVDPVIFQQNFEKQGRFMAGVETTYQPGIFTSNDTSFQHLAKGFTIGTRFHSVQVLRACDAKPIHLGHMLKADGRWRLILFGNSQPDCPTSTTSATWNLCTYFQETLIPKYTLPSQDIDSIFDIRAVFQQSRKSFQMTNLHPLLLPHKGTLGLQDYEKVFTDEQSYGFGFGKIFESRGVDSKGCVVVVRPDQYVSAVLPLGEQAEGMLGEFFGRIMIPVTRR